MVRKPSPELDALKEVAKQSEERVQAALHRLQRVLHAEEEAPEPSPEPYKNGRGH